MCYIIFIDIILNNCQFISFDSRLSNENRKSTLKKQQTYSWFQKIDSKSLHYKNRILWKCLLDYSQQSDHHYNEWGLAELPSAPFPAVTNNKPYTLYLLALLWWNLSCHFLYSPWLCLWCGTALHSLHGIVVISYSLLSQTAKLLFFHNHPLLIVLPRPFND